MPMLVAIHSVSRTGLERPMRGAIAELKITAVDRQSKRIKQAVCSMRLLSSDWAYAVLSELSCLPLKRQTKPPAITAAINGSGRYFKKGLCCLTEFK